MIFNSNFKVLDEELEIKAAKKYGAKSEAQALSILAYIIYERFLRKTLAQEGSGRTLRRSFEKILLESTIHILPHFTSPNIHTKNPYSGIICG